MRELLGRLVQNRAVLVAVLMVTYSIQSLAISASKRAGKFEYDPMSLVFLTEAMKICFALAMMPPEVRAALALRKSLPYAVPAVLYTVQNRLVYQALLHISPSEYQLFNNMKLLTTSIVYRVVMRRQLRVLQWMALMLLCLGMILTTTPKSGLASPGLRVGFFLMCCTAWCSAFAGVTNESLVKGTSSVFEANFWLYLYGSLVALLSMGPSGIARLPRFEGFTWIVCLVVVVNAILGQCIAYIFRYADSIVKMYATCAAMAFTTLISVVLFGFEMHLYMVCGYATCGISVCLFYAPVEVLMAPDVEFFGCSTAKSKASNAKQS